MKLLSPAQAAALAQGVYAINETPLLTTTERLAQLRCEPAFSVVRPGAQAHPFARSESGAAPGGLAPIFPLDRLFNPVRSDFGYCAVGNGDWVGHMIIVTRGTMGAMGTSSDWVSNYNIGMRPAPGGALAHAGFLTIWQGLRPFVETSIRAYGPTHIHCVGHSLGGALATLNADFISSRRAAKVAVYTFGAPRVGNLAFAERLTQRLGAGRIKRVYHPADPVPMIPMLPFFHAGGLRLSVPAGALVDASAHLMGTSYAPRMAGLTDEGGWDALARAQQTASDFQIGQWLRQAANHRGGWLMRSATLLENIGRALARLLARAAMLVIGSGVSAAVTAALTSLDLLAWLLARAAELAVGIAEEVAGLVRAIFGFLGRTVAGTVEVTRRALRWVLDLLFSFLSAAAHAAIDRVR